MTCTPGAGARCRLRVGYLERQRRTGLAPQSGQRPVPSKNDAALRLCYTRAHFWRLRAMPNFFARNSDTLITVGTIALAFVGFVTVIDQRFDAQDKLIDQRFTDQNKLIDQRFEAVDQRFVAVDQRFESVDQRFEALNHRFEAINQRFDAQDRRIDDLKADMTRRFDAQDERLDRLTDEVSELRKLTVGIIERVSRNEGEIDVIRDQLRTADKPAPPE